MTATTTSTSLKRHPIRGGLYGLVLGLGLALIVIGRKTVTLDSVVPIVLVVAGVVVGIAWSMLAPARKPKGAAPPDAAPVADEVKPSEAADETAEAPDEAEDSDQSEASDIGGGDDG